MSKVLKAAFCILAVGFPLAAFAGPATDSDSDGVVDVVDNCSNNPTISCDTDQDGYGNVCDCDLDNNNTDCTFGGDFAVFLADFAAYVGGAPGPFASDMNCDSSVDFASDFALFLAGTSASAAGDIGPGSTSGYLESGYPCAGTVTCP